MFSRTTAIALAGLTATIAAAGAHASPPGPDVVTVRVSVADLNLAGKPGASIALQRIRAAAGAICGDRPMVEELDRSALYDACLRSTVGQAVASLDNSLVTALYEGSARPPVMASR